MTERIGSERSAVQNSGTEPTLQKCLDELETIESDLRALTDGLSETGLRWRPGSGAWSILHCLEHVNRTTEVYLPNIDAAIERGRRRKTIGGKSSRGTLLGSWLIKSLEPPVKRRFKAPKTFQPLPDPDRDAVGNFVRLRSELRERIGRSSGLDLGRIRLSSPAMKILRVSLGQAFRVLAAHDRRHLWQAHNVKRNEAFPGGES